MELKGAVKQDVIKQFEGTEGFLNKRIKEKYQYKWMLVFYGKLSTQFQKLKKRKTNLKTIKTDNPCAISELYS